MTSDSLHLRLGRWNMIDTNRRDVVGLLLLSNRTYFFQFFQQ